MLMLPLLSTQVPEEKLTPFSKARGDGPQVLTSVTPIPNATRGQLAKTDPDHYVSIPAGRKHFICSGGGAKSRGRKFVDEENFLRNYIRQSWEQAQPRSMPEMKAEMWAQFGENPHSEFWKAYVVGEEEQDEVVVVFCGGGCCRLEFMRAPSLVANHAAACENDANI